MNDGVIDMSNPDLLLAEVRRLRAEITLLHERVELLDRLAHQDVLIELPNRRGFMRQLESAIDRVSRYDDHASVLFVDIDGLKMINDTFGHQAGDKVLSRFCDVARAALGPNDLFGRFGGEEFACLMPGRTLREGAAMAERIRADFVEAPVAIGPHLATGTVSVGVAMRHEASWRLDQLFTAADRALYHAKSKGRNCVEVARPPLHLVEPVSAA